MRVVRSWQCCTVFTRRSETKVSVQDEVTFAQNDTPAAIVVHRCATSSPTHTSRAVLPRANCSLRAPSTRNVRGWWILSALNAMCHPTWRHEAIEEYGLKRSLPFHPFKLLLEGRSSFQPGRAEPHLVTDASALEISDEAVQLFISCLRLRDCKADNRPSWHRFSKQLVSSRRSPCLRSSGKW